MCNVYITQPLHCLQPGKKKSARSASSARSAKSSKSVKSTKGSAKRKGKKSAKSARSRASTALSTTSQREPDMMDPPAMENLYYIAHGAVDALEVRGFSWPEAPKKKGKKGTNTKK